MRKALLLSAALFLVVAASLALAQREDPTRTMFPEMSTSQVKKMLDERDNFALVDARESEEYEAGHLPNAVNLPPGKLQFITSYLPRDKSVPIVFYCRGKGCSLSNNAAVVAGWAKFIDIRIYRGGYPAWVKAGHPVETGARQKRHM